MRRLTLLALVGCTSTSGPTDVVGPFTGPVTRYAVDQITLPTDNNLARQLADDLNGDGTLDNQLGAVIGTLASGNDANAYGSDMIAAGTIASYVELQAEDLTSSAKAGAAYFGATGDDAKFVGGSIVDGVFTSNRTATTHAPGSGVVSLPVFADADPSVAELDAMELDLTPDGAGGYDALVRGGFTAENFTPALCSGIAQMIANDPRDHLLLAHQLDTNRDGILSCDEITSDSLIQALTVQDVTLFGHQMVSFGFAAHLRPCDQGSCNTAPPADACHDRVRDGDETGVDCGGSTCAPCVTPSCSDGILDGLETDVDCGWNCGPCAAGKRCLSSLDCAEGLACLEPLVSGDSPSCRAM